MLLWWCRITPWGLIRPTDFLVLAVVSDDALRADPTLRTFWFLWWCRMTPCGLIRPTDYLVFVVLSDYALRANPTYATSWYRRSG